MATITTTNLAALLPPATKALKTAVHSSSVYGLPLHAMAKKGRVRCALEEKTSAACNAAMSSKTSMAASLMAAAAAVSTVTGPAIALVDERMSTEGTGLPFGLSNNSLGWILLGVLGLIWSLYFLYATGLDEDEDSRLSL